MLPNFIVSFNRVNDIFNTEITIREGDIETVDNVKSTIEFKNVSFQYPQSEKDILTNINFKLEPGKTTAIIGGTGSGKSTILNLISRLQDPSSGEILLNGENIKNFKLNALREQIGFSPQKAKLFAGTIRAKHEPNR
ncbi:ABC transporter ATP-binding protein [uncultured Methanobrevibacter sp.]|uniref:ABC transporter ATP-binding protein n=1 Tax=uncultured Methanobrevibacter sp. TaxID=253161 RepID=UPI0025D301B7|nr:ABC transporter ATP-binding protein [uncultured Methanobrevibacter sp.]